MFRSRSSIVHLHECSIESTEQACKRIIKFVLKTEMKQTFEKVYSVLIEIDNIF